MSSKSASPSSGSASTGDSRRMFWFTVSGWIGTALFYVFYEWVHALPVESRPSLLQQLEWSTVSWTGSYIISILWQHLLHRHLVFGTQASYWSSLFWTYVSYTLSIFLSSIINHVLVVYLNVYHRYSFNITLFITGIINYYTLKSAFNADDNKSNHQA